MSSNQALWSELMSQSFMAEHSALSDEWSHEYGVLLKAIEEVWRETNDASCFNYILRSIGPNIDEDGSIRGYQLENYSLDNLNSGRLLFPLYEVTGEERFRKAAFMLRQQYRTHPRTKEGGFWHKSIFPYQMFLDGSYMSLPFYAEFIRRYGEPAEFEDVIKQIVLLAQHTKDEQTGLFYHGWDEQKLQPWADPHTGRSPSFWSRAMGWYAMAIVDVLDELPAACPERDQLLGILQPFLMAVIQFQNRSTGLWHQITDEPMRAENYAEASASCMFVYTLAKSIRLGYLSRACEDAAVRGYQGILEHFIEQDEQAHIVLHGTCKTAGLGLFPHRDGSFHYYVNEPTAPNDIKGVGSFILASVEIERLRKS